MSANRDKIIRRLNRLGSRVGGLDVLRPEDVVADAKNPTSPLHGCFEWDDAKCGILYRLEQARTLIRGVIIETTSAKGEQTVSVAWVRDPRAEPNTPGYVHVSQLRSEKQLARAALLNELASISALIERASSLAVALGLEDELEGLAKSLERVRGRVDKAA